MIKKIITFEDYNGIERTEDFYFNLSKAELFELSASHNGDYATVINNVVDSKNVTEIMRIFKEFIEKAYGVKSDDGRMFMKSPEITKSFMQTEAYSVLLEELATSDTAAQAFVEGILPKQKTEIKEIK